MPLIDQIGDGGELLTFEWKIKDFFSLSDKSGDFYNSPSFNFVDTLLYLRLHPNAWNCNNEGKVSLFLARRDSGSPKTINYTLGVKSSDGITEKVDYKNTFSKKGSVYGRISFLSRSDLKNRETLLMPNNVLTLSRQLRSDDLSAAKDTPSVTTDQALKAVIAGEEEVLKSLLSMLKSGDDSDVVIKVRGKEFPAHRNILRARSAVFKSMFEHEMVEKNSRVVNIDDCDPGTFPDFLVHLYSGSCALSTENVYSLYTAADKYDVGDLKQPCSEFMKENITAECFCNVITLALKHNDKDLIECATDFFCKNSIDIAKTTEWQTFLTENATVGNELFIKAMSNYITLLNVSKN